jgi:chitin disaccharide deacetylase
MSERILIVNADDFGLAPSVNRGIVAAHERGVVTSTSLMVRGAAAAQAADSARAHPELNVGLHVDLYEWSHRGGEWVADYEVVDPSDAAAVAHEIERQLASFRVLLSRDPTHLDSHQHAHREAPVDAVLGRVADDLGVPLRDRDTGIRYRGDFYGQSGKGEPCPDAITVESLDRIIASLDPGVTELGCHPGERDPELASTYRDERAAELAVLCDPRARAAIERHGVRLASFAELART